jgi:uncharacterized SAM-binding protein YcdF (DUF218 family)
MLRRLVVALEALVAAWLLASGVLFLWSPWEASPPKRASAVVVLSGDHARLPRALALVRDGVAPVLAISSVRRTPRWREARRLCRVGRYAGARVVCFLAVPFSTRGEAETVSRLARARRWSSLVVVTSRFHVTRARMLFRRCWRGPLAVVGVASTWWRLPEDWASETGKLAVQLTVERDC